MESWANNLIKLQSNFRYSNNSSVSERRGPAGRTNRQKDKKTYKMTGKVRRLSPIRDTAELQRKMNYYIKNSRWPKESSAFSSTSPSFSASSLPTTISENNFSPDFLSPITGGLKKGICFHSLIWVIKNAKPLLCQLDKTFYSSHWSSKKKRKTIQFSAIQHLPIHFMYHSYHLNTI